MLLIYGSRLLIYHVFCDDHGIPDKKHASALPIIVHSFISSLADGYSGDTV